MLEKAGQQADEILRAAAAQRAQLADEAARERDRLAAAAAEERARLDAEAAAEREQTAAAAAARLAELQEQVAGLCRQRDQARSSLRGLSSRIGEALQAVTATAPDANIAVEGMTYSDSLVESTDGRPEATATDAPPEQRASADGVLLVRRPAAATS
jgi:colicin import membrane protein